MKKHIDRISINDISYDDFLNKYYLPEIPVILTDVHIAKDSDLTPEKIKAYFYNENNREAGWFDAELPKQDTGPIKLPNLVSSILKRNDISMRKRPMRAFMQPNGHKTLLHYDGNSLNGLNLQVRGKKEWTIISPDASISIMPFNFVASVSEGFTPSDTEFDYYNFTTSPGELLFLPRYWLHEVSCKDDININLNWVFTPNTPNYTSKLGQREGELLKLREILPFIRKITVNGGELYGGAGEIIEKNYIKSVKASAAFTRLFKEIAAIVPFLLHIKDIKHQAAKFSNNNFNVTP